MGVKRLAIEVNESSVFELWKKAGRPLDVRIEGSSMRPLIRPGDTVSLCLIDGDELRTGDLIAFRQDGDLIVHRLIKQRRTDKTWRLCQKGDNLSGWGWLREDGVLGRVESIRGQGKVINMDTRPWPWINRVMGISGLLWVSAVEEARLLKACVAVDRPLPILSRLVSRMGRILNRACAFIIIKAIGGGIKRS